MKYYKATRPNGTDFYTGSIDYAAACGTGEVLRHPSRKRRDEPSTYISTSIAEADCTGFRWPGRLFRVEPVGRPMTATDLPNKRAVSALRVIEELPAHGLFGPQGEEVVALIERWKRMTPDEAQRLDVARAVARAAAGAAAGDAAWGLVVRDLIAAEHFEMLYGPWGEVMES